MLICLILLPLVAALLAVMVPWYRVRSSLLVVVSIGHLLMTATMLTRPVAACGPWIGLDALSRLVLLVTSLLYFGCALYAVGYLDYHRARGNRVMVPCLLVFLAAMTLAVLARHLGLLWLAVETTTLASAPLVYYNRNRLSIEATWKYLLLCSVGIALALLGIFFIAYSALVSGIQPVDLRLDVLLAAAPGLSRPWLHSGFVFVLVGFGTKMGLAPLHCWKPDAYGEAPGLVGALLAGGLTSVAFLAILRAVQLMTAAGDGDLARQALLLLGLLSMAVAAISMVRQPDIKRLLAYSSVEHMGILAIGVGMGKLATFGALLHLVNNALTKGGLFLSVANLQRGYGSKKLCEVRGAIATLPVSGMLFLAGFLAITGSPPFGPFMSLFTILRGTFAHGAVAVGLVMLLLLAVVFVGMGATVLTATQGPAAQLDSPYRDKLLVVLPPVGFILMVVVLGVWLPEPLADLIRDAGALLEVTS